MADCGRLSMSAMRERACAQLASNCDPSDALHISARLADQRDAQRATVVHGKLVALLALDRARAGLVLDAAERCQLCVRRRTGSREALQAFSADLRTTRSSRTFGAAPGLPRFSIEPWPASCGRTDVAREHQSHEGGQRDQDTHAGRADGRADASNRRESSRVAGESVGGSRASNASPRALRKHRGRAATASATGESSRIRS